MKKEKVGKKRLCWISVCNIYHYPFMLWCFSMYVLVFYFYFFFTFYEPRYSGILVDHEFYVKICFSPFIQIILVVQDYWTSTPREQKYLIKNGNTRWREPNQNVCARWIRTQKKQSLTFPTFSIFLSERPTFFCIFFHRLRFF